MIIICANLAQLSINENGSYYRLPEFCGRKNV